MLKYDFDITYVPGKDMLLADALSRAYLEDNAQEGSVEKEIECQHNKVPPNIGGETKNNQKKMTH